MNQAKMNQVEIPVLEGTKVGEIVKTGNGYFRIVGRLGYGWASAVEVDMLDYVRSLGMTILN